MPEHFDPYHKWLSIPPREQPPDHYRLLGLARFESDADVIANAADQRMGHLRTFQTGPHGEESQRLLNEVARAKVCLLNPRRKTAYDTVLRSAAPADAEPVLPGKRKAAVVEEQGALRSGQTFGRFRLAECLRQTRLSVVYRAEDVEYCRSYSLKLLTPEAARDAKLSKRFRREIEITRQLSHPHIIAGYDGGELGGRLYLVTEYVVGTDLQTLVTQCGPLPVDEAVEYVGQAARGLAQLHLLGVFHRNVTPRNLVLDLQGHLKVTNLLLARIQEGSEMDQGGENLTQMGDAMGTAEFLAPEQALDPSKVDQRADIYGLGCTLFFLLCGRSVYPAKSITDKILAHKLQPIPSLRAHCRQAPDWLDRVFPKMVAKTPEGRFMTMLAVADALSAPRRKETLWSRLRRLVLGRA